MASIINPKELAASLTPTQFELLVRAYIAEQLTRLEENPGNVMFWLDLGYGKTAEPKNGHWQLGVSTNKPLTRGEVLADVVIEQNRRNNFDKSCKLALIEHEPSVE